MKVRMVGKAVMNFTDEDTGEVINGMQLYYYAPKNRVDGFFAGQLWLHADSIFYKKLMTINFDKPLMAELVYDVQPGKKVSSVLVDIKLLEEKDFVSIDIKKAG